MAAPSKRPRRIVVTRSTRGGSTGAAVPPFLIFVLRLTFILVGLSIVLISGLFGFSLHQQWQHAQQERQIQTTLYQELAAMPEIELLDYESQGGQGLVSLNIKGKGPVSFWYGIDRRPVLVSVDELPTKFNCFYLDSAGQRGKYAYSQSLSLGADTSFEPWFPSKVNSVVDLIEEFDQLVFSLRQLPQNPELEEVETPRGTVRGVRQPNPEFTLLREYKNQPVACDLFVAQP